MSDLIHIDDEYHIQYYKSVLFHPQPVGEFESYFSFRK